MEKLTSTSNEKIKLFKKLSNSKKIRKEKNQFVIEGLRLCFDASLAGEKFFATFLTERILRNYNDKVLRIIEASEFVYLISEKISLYMGDTENAQGIFCICNHRIKSKPFKIVDTSKIVILESVKDPSNLGAIFRSAEAFGVSDIILSKDCVDVYNPKVLRGSMGAVFRLNLIEVEDIESIILKILQQGCECFATVLDEDAESIKDCVRIKSPFAVIFGNEANGISKNILNLCERKIKIPMKGRAESLNVAVAASVVMWEMF